MIDLERIVRDGRWVEGGRVWPNLDCYGVILHGRAQEGAPEWPSFDGVTKDGNGLDIAGREFATRCQKCEPEHMAVICCYQAGLMVHVGLIVETPAGLQVLESNPGSNITLRPLRRFKRQHINTECYR